MHGASGKHGRGRGGGGPVKRNIHSSFHSTRPATAPAGRLPVGGARNRSTTPVPVTSAADETFSLITGNPLKFAMIVKVTPDLIDEIKRAESLGDVVRMKFDANANNTSGNVIDVGGKDFRFTWSREMGDLCDIYEERRGSEDGNGLLVESGGAWRKLNVQRVLDETTQNNLKMRSEEAQLQKKSRKAIILDSAKPSMKNQTKALAGADVNTWRSFKPNKEPPPPPFKKRKAELLSVGGPPKTTIKSSATPIMRGRLSASPLASTPPEQSGAPPSPFGLNKNNSHMENITPPSAAFMKEMPNRGTGQDNDKQGNKGISGGQSQATDLQSLLKSLLTENPKGMTIKALEKAVGETYPNSTKQMESIIKKIANYQSPGKYILKPVVESESSFNKLSPESGSSPEDNQHRIPEMMEKMPSLEQIELNSRPEEESEAVELENVDIELNSPQGEKKASDNRDGPTGSSSESGSESDSDSESSSGSESGSHRSPVGSNSASSSDTETDDDGKASTNSKMASDEDVDIMSGDDDNKDSNNILEPSGFSGPFLHNRIEIEKDLPGNDNFDSGHRVEIQPEATNDSYIDHGNLHVEKKSKGKSKRGSDGKHADNIPDRGAKRHKPGKSTHSQTLNKPLDIQTFADRGPVGDGADFGLLKDYNNQTLYPGKSVSDSQQSGRRSIDNVWPRTNSSVERPGLRFGEKSAQGNEDLYPMQKGNEDGYFNEDMPVKKSKSTQRTDLNRSLVINGRGPVLQRELSDLELGEFREAGEVPGGGVKKQFERKSSFKQSDNKPTSSSDYWNSDLGRGKPAAKTNASDSVNHNAEELTRGRAVPAHPNYNSNVDHSEGGSDFRRSVGNGVEGYGDTHKRMPVHLQQLQRGMAPNSTSESKKHKSSNGIVSGETNGRIKHRESPFDDEAHCPYAKYDKDPQMKEPIKDFEQFEEYLEEYKEKYDSYLALNKILEDWRDEFLPYQKEYEDAKGRDMDRYYKLREEINEKYRPIKQRHARLKKIFCILHEEIKQLKELIKDFGDEYAKD